MPDHHSVRCLQITDGRFFRHILGIGEHRESALIHSVTGHFQDGFDRSSNARRRGAHLHDDRVTSGRMSKLTGAGCHLTEITDLSGS